MMYRNCGTGEDFETLELLVDCLDDNTIMQFIDIENKKVRLFNKTFLPSEILQNLLTLNEQDNIIERYKRKIHHKLVEDFKNNNLYSYYLNIVVLKIE